MFRSKVSYNLSRLWIWYLAKDGLELLYCCRLKYRDYRCISVYTAYAVLRIKSGGLHFLPPRFMYFCFGDILLSSLLDQLPACFVPSLARFLQPVLPSLPLHAVLPACTTVPGWCNLWKDRRKERQILWGIRKAVSQGDRGDSLSAYRRESQVHTGPCFKKPPDHHQCYQCFIVSLLPACGCWVNF